MSKERISISLDGTLRECADVYAAADGRSRSEWIEDLIRAEQDRRVLHGYATKTVSALRIDDYADRLYRSLLDVQRDAHR
jgi:metal-responsive CopG/Arc/MetJ family transcriptional regulator